MFSESMTFVLEIIQRGDSYLAVARCPELQSSPVQNSFALPLSDDERGHFRQLAGRGSRPISSKKGGDHFLDAETKIAAFGSRLFDAVFANDVHDLYEKCMDEIGRSVRVQLDLQNADLADLPWECLYDDKRKQFLAKSQQTPIVRYVPPVNSVPAAGIDPAEYPINIIVLIASPDGYAPLNIEKEWENIESAVKPLQEHGIVNLIRITMGEGDESQRDALRDQLQQTACHIFHYIGHGDYDESSKQTYLVWEKADGQADLVHRQHLLTMFGDETELRLMILNACEGGKATAEEPLLGIAQQLARMRVPAVIANQTAITDAAAIRFAAELYKTLVRDSYTVEAAVAEGRKAIADSDQTAKGEWAIPVLYTHAENTRLFPQTAGELDPNAPPPYKGLEVYKEEDAHLFFGREELTTQLLERIEDEWVDKTVEVWGNIMIIVGASGSGKSSLVRAGLLPTLRSQGWTIHTMVPTAKPLKALATTLTQNQDSVTDTSRLIADMKETPDALDIHVSRLVGSEGQLLLVVDQFEEVFTQCKDATERQHFINNLMMAVKHDNAVNTHLIITLRADFYHKCAEYPDLREALKTQQEYIGGMTAVELRQAIEKPLPEGYTFEEGLLDEIIDDCGEGGQPEPGTLPLLSYALLKMWEERRGGILTLAEYIKVGKVHGALSNTADAIYADLTPDEQKTMRNIFLRMTEFGENTQDSRRRVLFSELGDDPTTKKILHNLVNKRLITLNETTAEVSHESLIRQWTLLQEWLDADREGILLHRRLTEHTQEWLKHNRDTTLLYYGMRLEHWSEWKEYDASIMLNPQEEQFIDASIAARDAHQAEAQRLAQEREDARQRELAQQKALAEKQKALAEEQRERARDAEIASSSLRRRLYYAVGAFGLAVLLAVIALGLFYRAERSEGEAKINEARAVSAQAIAEAETDRANSEKQNAETARIEAVNAQGMAETARIEAVNAQIEAENAQFEAVEQSKLSLAQALSLQSITAGDNHNNDNELEILLALNAIQINRDYEGSKGDIEWVTYDALHTILSQPFRNVQIRDEINKPVFFSVDYSPDGNWFAAGSLDDGIYLWSLTSGNMTPIILSINDENGENNEIVNVITFSPDSKQLAIGHSNGMIRLFMLDVLSKKSKESENIDLHTYSTKWEEHIGAITSLVYLSDGRLVVSGNNSIRLWDLEAGESELISSGEPTQHIDSITINNDNDSPSIWLVTTGGWDNKITVRDVSDPPLITTTITSPSIVDHNYRGISTIASSPDGKTIAAGGWNGSVYLWSLDWSLDNLTTTQAVSITHSATISGNGNNSVKSVAFSPDGQWLAATDNGEDGVPNIIRLHAVDEMTDSFSSSVPIRLSGHTKSIEDLAFSTDGRLLASAGSWDQMIRVWSIQNPLRIPQPLVHKNPQHWGRAVHTVAFSADGTSLVSGDEDGRFYLRKFDQSNNLLEETIPVFNDDFDSGGAVTAQAFSHNGKWMASSHINPNYYTATIHLWEHSETLTLTDTLPVDSWVRSVAFSADDKWLAFGDVDGKVHFWNVESGKTITTTVGHEKSVHSVAFSADDKWLASGSIDHKVILWDIREGIENAQAKKIWTDHKGWISSLAFSPDSQWLASGSADHTIGLYDLDQDEMPDQASHLFKGHIDWVHSVTFAPHKDEDGETWLASSSADNMIHLWNVDQPKNRPIALSGHTDAVYTVAFSPQGDWLASSSADNTVRLWRPFLDQLVEVGCKQIRRGLTDEEQKRYYITTDKSSDTCHNWLDQTTIAQINSESNKDTETNLKIMTPDVVRPSSIITISWHISSSEQLILKRTVISATKKITRSWDVTAMKSITDTFDEAVSGAVRYELYETIDEGASGAVQYELYETIDGNLSSVRTSNWVYVSCEHEWHEQFKQLFNDEINVAERHCPVNTTISNGGQESHQNGAMIWVEELNQIVVWAEGINGELTFGRILTDTFNRDSLGVSLGINRDPIVDPFITGLDPELKLMQPTRGFGKIWRELPEVREKLGWALTDGWVDYEVVWQRQQINKDEYIDYILMGHEEEGKEGVIRIQYPSEKWDVRYPKP